MNCLTWNPTLQLRLEPIVKGGNYLSRVFKECVIKETNKDSNRATEKTPTSNDKHISKIYYARFEKKILTKFYIVRIYNNKMNYAYTVEEIGSRPVNIPIVKSDTYIGGDPSTVAIHTIDIMEFSTCGQYLSIRHRIYPGTLWVWDIRTNGVDILILQNNISGKNWSIKRKKELFVLLSDQASFSFH